MAGFLFRLHADACILVSYTYLARIARIECHENASSAPPDQGMTMLLNRQPRGERARLYDQPQDFSEQVSRNGGPGHLERARNPAPSRRREPLSLAEEIVARIVRFIAQSIQVIQNPIADLGPGGTMDFWPRILLLRDNHNMTMSLKSSL